MAELTKIPGTTLRHTVRMPVVAAAVTVAVVAALVGCATGVGDDAAAPSTTAAGSTSKATTTTVSATASDGASPSTSTSSGDPSPATTAADAGDAADVSRPPSAGDGRVHAVVRVERDDLLNVREQPNPRAQSPGGFTPFQMGISVTGDDEKVGNQRWVAVDGGTGMDLDGWVNAAFLVPIQGDTDQTFWFYRDASAFRELLSSSPSAQRIGEQIAATDPAGEVVVSADGYFDGDDQVLTVADLKAAGSASDATRTWGSDPGSGEPVTATIEEFFADFGSEASLTTTEAVAIDERIQFGNTVDNAREFFPDGVVVELHHAGDEADDYLSWRTTRMVLKKVSEADEAGPTPEQDWQLVGLAFDSWTP